MSKLSQDLAAIRRNMQSLSDRIDQLTASQAAEREARAKQELAAIRRDMQSLSDRIDQLTSLQASEREVLAKGVGLLTKTVLEISASLSGLNEKIGPRDLEQPIPSETLEGNDLESFRFYSALAQQRITLQNKCVKLSIQVTLAFAAAVTGIFAWVSKDLPVYILNRPFHLPVIAVFPIALVLAVYVFIQLLLLTNYIYSTVMVISHNWVYGTITQRSASTLIENAARLRAEAATARLSGRLVNNFQPAVLYGSTEIGLLVFVVFSLIMNNFNATWWYYLFLVPLWVWLVVLLCLHRRAEPIAAYIALEGDHQWRLRVPR